MVIDRSYLVFSQEILRHSNSASELAAKDIVEALHSLFQHSGVSYKPEELTLLSEKICSANGVNSANSSVSAVSVIEFCAQEADRHEWTLVGNRYAFSNGFGIVLASFR